MQETWVWSLAPEDPLEKEMATHSSILASKILQMEKPSRLQSTGSQSRTRLSNFTSLLTFRQFREQSARQYRKAHCETPAANMRPSYVFISLWITWLVLTAFTELDCQRNGQFGRSHTEKSTFPTHLEITTAQGCISKEPERTVANGREMWSCQTVASPHMNTELWGSKRTRDVTATWWISWK